MGDDYLRLWEKLNIEILTSKEMGEWLAKRDRKRDIRVREDERNKTIDECIKIISRETHSGTLVDYLEELKECGKNKEFED